MSRWTGSWLSGPGSARESDPAAEPGYRGERLGLPEAGLGSVAGTGRRFLALLIDWLPGALIGNFLTTNPAVSAMALFALLTVVSLAAFGRTPGHWVAGIKPASLAGAGERISFGHSVLRTLLLCLVIPPLVMDVDGRGLHDHVARTVMTIAR
ncbi:MULTISPECIES: RDD family protein [unclassified Crossiella]|uniref:RDD family protein n=1 Tax=unclassified Crossiella TaxID=2620835 RepID=UPI0020002DC1|nr:MULTISPECIES: RDD family protein [unclassified Crossiella]MCK2245383.1 RDD family protein [Crossiella sp. S99.2]MCK2259030.1 RDD family protein [Crossiella sp. S99.1]